MRKKSDTQNSTATLSLLAFGLIILFVVAVYHWGNSSRNLPRLDTKDTNTAIRGSIVTKDGFEVANSHKLYKVSIDTRSIDKNKLDMFVRLYCIYTNDSEKRVKTAIEKTKGTLVLSYKIDAKTAVHLKELSRKLNLKKVFVSFYADSGKANPPIRMSVTESGEKRSFIAGDSLTPLIGYNNKKEIDGITKITGIKGIEKYYDYYISPIKNELIEGPRDIGDNIIYEKQSLKAKRLDGYNVNLNISLRIQKLVEELLDERVDRYQAKEIVAGILNSKTGEILTLATNLRYNPENITKKDFPNLNLTATEYAYEVGSVIKPIVFAITYDNGKVKPEEIINTHGGAYSLGKRVIKDTHKADSMSAADVIVHSSNIGMIEIASRIDGQTLHNGFLSYNLATKTGIDLPYEQRGYIPSISDLDNKIYKATTSYGYGLQVTFIQILSAFSVFNNDGILISPRIVNSLRLGTQNYKVNEAEVRQVTSKETAAIIKDILIQTVQKGTGRNAKTPGLLIGGKTGTARIASGGGYSNLYNSSFIGFANDENSSYTIGVFVREPKRGSYYAAQNALPTFKAIVDILVQEGYLKPKPDAAPTRGNEIVNEEIID